MELLGSLRRDTGATIVVPQQQRPGFAARRHPWLAATLGEIAVTAGRTSTFLGQRYRRIAKRRGKQRALVAVGNSILTIVWHLLADPKPATAIWVPASTSPAAAGTARNTS